MSRSMLVIADQQKYDRFLLEKAYKISASLDAKLEIARFLAQLNTQSELERKQLIEREKQNLNLTIEDIFSDNLQVQSHVIPSDNIANWVEDICEQKHFDLVVKTGHRTESLFHTPTDWQLIRQLSSPLLIANTQKWKSKPVVMSTVDLSTKEEQHQELNDLVLRWTAIWSNAFYCSAHVVYSIPIANALLEFDIVEEKKYLEKEGHEVERQLSKLLEHFELNDVHTHITAGPPEKTIPHIANELKADLVIMGCVGRSQLKGFLIGNTAEKVLHHLRTDTLIVEASRL